MLNKKINYFFAVLLTCSVFATVSCNDSDNKTEVKTDSTTTIKVDSSTMPKVRDTAMSKMADTLKPIVNPK